MNRTERYKRLRLLLKTLNQRRKRQASQIDILCNDLIAAQREFTRRLNDVGFAAQFYKELLGAGDLRSLLARAGRLVKEELPGTAVSFALRQTDGCELYPTGGDESDEPGLEQCLTSELMESICKSNQRCTLGDMFGMGLEGNLQMLNRISAATIPLSDLGRSLGFVLIYRISPPLRAEELDRVALVACGLSRAIQACGMPLHSRS